MILKFDDLYNLKKIKGEMVLKIIIKYVTLIALLVIIIYFSQATDFFMTFGNFRSILKEWSILATLALGFTFVLVVNEFDLSFGYLIALCSVGCALLINAGFNIFLVIFLILIIGILTGIINGLLVAILGLPAFIATIGTGTVCQGINYIFSQAAPIPIPFGFIPEGFIFIGQDTILGLPATLIIFIPLTFLLFFILKKSKLGQHLYTIGINPNAAKKVGISISRGKIIAFIFCGLGAAIVGILLTSRSGSGQSIAGPEYLLEVFASVFFGIGIFKEGQPTVEGSLLGAFFMVVVANGLTLMNMPFYILKIIQGVIILAGISINNLRRVHII